jgi:hypothetical protein
MPEYFRVNYIEQRDVFVDGVKMGRTNRRIEIGGGTYAINMGTPRDYRPGWQLATIIDTYSDEPMIVSFEKIEGEDT